MVEANQVYRPARLRYSNSYMILQAFVLPFSRSLCLFVKFRAIKVNICHTWIGRIQGDRLCICKSEKSVNLDENECSNRSSEVMHIEQF